MRGIKKKHHIAAGLQDEVVPCYLAKFFNEYKCWTNTLNSIKCVSVRNDKNASIAHDFI